MRQEYYDLVDDISGRNDLYYAIQAYKKCRKRRIIITIILLMLCIGVMYLRFRVIGR